MLKVFAKKLRPKFAPGSATMLVVMVLLAVQPATVCRAAEHHPISLQIFHPLATSPDPETTTNARFALFYGRSGHIAGFDASAVASITNGDFTGLQLTGLFNRTNGDFTGMSINAGVQANIGPATGIQFAGLANFHHDFFAGAQFAGALNYTRKGFFGAQLSSIMNLNDGYGGYLQASSVANVNVRDFGGMQLAIIMNFAGDDAYGAQVALLNYADRMNGVQVGAVNMTEEISGLQFGIVNIAKKNNGTPVGMVNIADDGLVQGLVYGSNLALYNAGVRTVVNRWTSVVSLGYSDQSSDAENSGFLGWHFGRLFPLSEQLGLNLDAGILHIIPQDYDDPDINDDPHFALQMRLFADYRLGKAVSLVGGGGFSTIFSEYTTHARSRTEGHVFGGISLF